MSSYPVLPDSNDDWCNEVCDEQAAQTEQAETAPDETEYDGWSIPTDTDPELLAKLHKRFDTPQTLPQGDMEWMIADFIPEGLTFIGSLPGIGKTWVALEITKALLTGKSLWGAMPVAKRRNVLYLVPENRPKSYRKRLDTLQMMNLKEDGPKLFIRTLDRKDPMGLKDDDLIEMCRIYKPVIVLDTFARFNTAKDENDAQQLTIGILADLLVLQTEGAIAIVALHHSSRSSQQGADRTNVLRGSGNIHSTADAIYGISLADEKSDDFILKIENHKARDFDGGAPKPIIISGVNLKANGGFILLSDYTKSSDQMKIDDLGTYISENRDASNEMVRKAIHIGATRLKEMAAKAGWTKPTAKGKWEKISTDPDTGLMSMPTTGVTQ